MTSIYTHFTQKPFCGGCNGAEPTLRMTSVQTSTWMKNPKRQIGVGLEGRDGVLGAAHRCCKASSAISSGAEICFITPGGEGAETKHAGAGPGAGFSFKPDHPLLHPWGGGGYRP